MGLKVFADRRSSPSRAIIIFCKMNWIDFEEVRIYIYKGQHRTAEFATSRPRPPPNSACSASAPSTPPALPNPPAPLALSFASSASLPLGRLHPPPSPASSPLSPSDPPPCRWHRHLCAACSAAWPPDAMALL
ncbi:Glutathione S-transferase T1 [Carex littledalei]|uniref:Glutathione S-transferase T1 n=1 Tax=Carex littledalei TaxID=544730 RepID=A0A833RIB8_9POAL|nr:Glutathione S-transferase T1 [Carex littledalei]